MPRNFLITLNQVEYFEDVKKYLKGLKSFQYAIAGKEEAPTTGHLHIHIYLQLNHSLKRLNKEGVKRAHVDSCWGSPEENVDYVSKNGNIIWEEGEMKTNTKTRFPTIEEVKKMKSEERDKLPLQYYNIVERINREEREKIKGTDYHKEVKVYWFYGKSGAGKTTNAIELIGDREFNDVKFDGRFWHGVTNDCKIALYDDFRASDMKPVELINFIDYNRHIMNIKGGSKRNNYEEIYITSIQDPREIYENCTDEYRKQWLRRLTGYYEIKRTVIEN